MITLKASKIRIPAGAIRRAAYHEERVRIVRRDGRCVYLVSEADIDLLDTLEGRYWAKQGNQALQAFRRSKRKPIPLEAVKRRLGL